MGAIMLLAVGGFLYWAYQRADTKPRRRRKPVADAPHAVLGVAADASPDEIRRAYQEKVRQVHPDKAAGTTPELERLAEARTKELNQAYQALMRTR